MVCPYCQNEMKPGSIDVYDTLSWSPQGESRPGPTKFTIAKHGIKLASYSLLFSASKQAFYCPNCQKIILDVTK